MGPNPCLSPHHRVFPFLTARPSWLYSRWFNLLLTPSSTLAVPLSAARCPSHPSPFLLFLHLLDVVSRHLSANKDCCFVQQSVHPLGSDGVKHVALRAFSLHSSPSHCSTPSLRRAQQLPLASRSTSPVPTGFKRGSYFGTRSGGAFHKAARRLPSFFF
jgi:hypothetical protein